jgi:hypothetical protein
MAQSPRFKLRQKEISAVINKSRLKQTWRNKVRSALRSQFLPDALDFYDYQLHINRIVERIENSVFAGTYTPKAPKRISQEKSKGLCRLLTIPDVADIIVLQCLSDALYSDIKNKQPAPEKAFFELADHSFATKDNLFTDPEYGSFKSWLDFQKELLRFTREREWIVITDIANYYDFINYTHLRNIIASTINIRESILDFLIFVLSSMLWQPDYTPRFEIGLPQINVDAPRILAHCFLFELDRVIAERKEIDYARFMDDIDLGVDTYKEAKQILKQIDLVLQTRQVRLNSGKTKILTKKDAEAHFKIRENVLLDKLVASINSKHQNNKNLKREQMFTSFCIEYGFRRKIFDEGNGEKILKRLLTIAGKLDAEIGPHRIAETLIYRPSSRDHLFRYYSLASHRKDAFLALLSYFNEQHVIDDVSWINFAKSIVSAKTPRENYVYNELQKLFDTEANLDFFELHAKLWLFSKYADSEALLHILRYSIDLWSTDETLGRVAGGLYPLFLQDKNLDSLERIISRSNNRAAEEVFRFHNSLSKEAYMYRKISRFILEPNESLPNKISHAKFLMLLTVLQGHSISEDERRTLIKIHHRAFSDGFYAIRLRPLV